MRRLFALATLLLLLPVQAQEVDGMLLVGPDPAGDAIINLAEGTGDPGGLYDANRLDITSLHLALDGAALRYRLGIGSLPTGAFGGYMYRVSATVGDTTYFTCWNIQSIGSGAADQENVLGCSRFTETQVGPDTLETGVVMGQDDLGPFIQWDISLGDLGVESLVEVTTFSADTWFRGAASACSEGGSQSGCLWNLADMGPDEGGWLPPSGEAPTTSPSGYTLDLQAANATAVVPKGGVHNFTLTIQGGGALPKEALPLRVEPPLGWSAAIEPSSIVVTKEAQQLLVRLEVPELQAKGNFSFEAQVGEAVTDAVALAVQVVDPAPPTPTQASPDGKDTPAGGLLLALLAVALVLRRRT